jgi:Flp pilus assembly pilin Flp
MSAIVKKLISHEEGATMVEYGLMLLFIAVVCFAVIRALGVKVETFFHVPPWN